MSNRALTTFVYTALIILGVGTYWWHSQATPQNKNEAETKLAQLNHSIQHLAIIMDGNRRWAKQQGLMPWEGHKSGIDPVKKTVEFCIEQKIPHLSLYTFSLENFNRSQKELDVLFDTIKRGLTNEEFTKLTQHGVRVRFIGDRSRFPESLHVTINDIEEKTASGKNLQLNLLFCYGGQQELTAAMQELGKKIAAGTLKPTEITPELIQQHLWMAHGPNPDLIIRTSGVRRLSNFLSWQSAYSELMFLDFHWPEITKQSLYEAIKKFEKIKRNFGQ